MATQMFTKGELVNTPDGVAEVLNCVQKGFGYTVSVVLVEIDDLTHEYKEGAQRQFGSSQLSLVTTANNEDDLDLVGEYLESTED